MTPPAHLSSAYLVYASLAQTVHLDDGLLFGVAVAGSFAPDIDGLFGAKMKDHRNTEFHAPLSWLSLFVVSFAILKLLQPEYLLYLSTFFFGVFVHLFVDWFSARTSGIRILYPFSNKNYALFRLTPERGEIPTLPKKNDLKHWGEFWKFYFSKKFLVFIEILVITSPLFVYVVFR